MISRFRVSKDLNPRRILEAEDASSNLKPSSMGFMGPCNERASWENGPAWCHVVRVPNTPNKPTNHGERPNLRPWQPVCLDRLGPKGFCNVWSFVRHEARPMLEAGRHGINGIGSPRYQATKVIGITNATTAY